jgi:hypothetical protein
MDIGNDGPRQGGRSRAASRLRALTGEGRNSSRSQCTRDGHRFESVRANRRGFLVRRIARHFRGLRRRQSVCWVVSTVSAAHWRRVRSKVYGGKFPFPELLFAAGSSRVRVGAWSPSARH